MRRLLILMMVAALLLIAVPASAKKPEPPAELDCHFDDGVLWLVGVDENGEPTSEPWDGSAGIYCRWDAGPYVGKPLQFEMRGSGRVQIPHVIVGDVYPNGGDICLNSWESGWHDLPYEGFPSFTLPNTLNGCGEAPDSDEWTTFGLWVTVQRVRRGDVRLVLDVLNEPES